MTDWSEVLAPGITTIGVVAAAALTRNRGGTDHRAELKADLEILDALPSESPAREALLADIERRIVGSSTADTKRRDPAGVALGFFFLGLAIWLAVLAVNASGALHGIFLGCAIAVGALGIYGVGADLRKVERDAKGRPIR